MKRCSVAKSTSGNGKRNFLSGIAGFDRKTSHTKKSENRFKRYYGFEVEFKNEPYITVKHKDLPKACECNKAKRPQTELLVKKFMFKRIFCRLNIIVNNDVNNMD